MASSNVADLIIDNAQPSDSGTYSCVAQNSAGPVEDRIQLIVSEDENEITGEDTGRPPYKNEEENKSSVPTRGDLAGGDESTGIIPNAKPEEDLVHLVGSRAIFTCNAGNYNHQLPSESNGTVV